MEYVSAGADMRRRVTNIYISIMLLIFPLFPGFSGYSNITFSKYTFFVACTGLWLALLLFFSLSGRFDFPALRIHHLAAMLFGLVCVLSWLLSPHLGESLIGAGRYDGLVTQLLYVCIFLGVSLFGSAEKRHFVCLGIGLGLCSAVAIVQVFNIDIFGLFPGDYSHYDAGLRYSGAFLGTMGNTNVLSAYYCLAIPALFALPVLRGGKSDWIGIIPLCLAVFVLIRAGVSGGFVGLGFGALVAAPLVLTDMGRIRRALTAAAPLLISAALALAFSPEYSLNGGFNWSFLFGRMPLALVCFAALCLALSFVLGKIGRAPGEKALRRAILLLCAAVLLLALIFVYFSPATEGTIYELSQVMRGNVDEKFGSSRILIWRECLALFSERPLLGGGPDTLALRVDVQFSRLVEETGKTLSSGVDNAHNEYLGYLINTGIFGLASYVFLLALGFCAWLRGRCRREICALGTGALCYCAQSFFALGLPLVAPMFWISLALIFSGDLQPTDPTTQEMREKYERRKTECSPRKGHTRRHTQVHLLHLRHSDTHRLAGHHQSGRPLL